jgi:hypothetical protein
LRRVVARVWRSRETTEREAAQLFADLAHDLQGLGADPSLVSRARKAERDEMRHAVRCSEIVASFESEPSVPDPPDRLRLGPIQLGPAKRALFASVALCCVTETLSTALLLEMRNRAADALVRRTVHEILRDEVEHARVGWAHLAIEARRRNSSWLAPYVPGMLAAAVRGDLASSSDDLGQDLSAYGILPRPDVRRVLRDVAADVLLPGLERFDVDTTPARACIAHLVAG